MNLAGTYPRMETTQRPLLAPVVLVLMALCATAAGAEGTEPPMPRALLEQASEGDLVAQAKVCVGYLLGQDGFEESREKALPFCRMGAERGVPGLQNIMGKFHHQGWADLEQDYARALKWYRLAAEQGNPSAQANLGGFHHLGLGGLEADSVEAARYYELAAKQGLTRAMRNLAYLYEHGEGVPMDIEEAKRLYRQAAEAGDSTAQAHVERLENR